MIWFRNAFPEHNTQDHLRLQPRSCELIGEMETFFAMFICRAFS
jgi:hypothetical protein